MRAWLYFAAIFAIAFQADCEARAGGGGGRGAGGGRSSPGRSMSVQRSPSMSRTTARPSPRQSSVAQNRPVQQRAPQNLRNQPNTAARRADASQFRQSFPQAVNASQANQIRQNLPNLDASRRQTANNIRNNTDFSSLQNRFDRAVDNRYDSNLNWRQAAAWTAAAGWLDADWGYPLYYDSGYYYPYNDSSYYPTNTTAVPVQTPTSSNLVVAGQNMSSPAGDWLPLGIYALTKDGSANYANMYIQLAMNKQGVINGTFYNKSTNSTQPLDGVVDQQSQTASVRISNNSNSPVLQTGLYNLTQPQAPVRLTFASGQSQDWLLTRMQ